MTTGVVARLTLIYGTLAALLLVAPIWNDGERDAVVLLAFAALTMVGFFVLYRVTFARWWNQRAARLRQDEISPRAA